MKLSWTGTDVMRLNNTYKRKLLKRPYWILFRLIVRFFDMTMIEGHTTNCEWLREELLEFGFKKKIEIQLTPLKHPEWYQKVPHTLFNVLYYKPPQPDIKFRDWVYGVDLIQRLRKEYMKTIQFISVDGEDDMKRIYPLIDMYLRPNRHDGYSRMVRECDIQGIPYYWSHKDPDYDEMKKILDDEIEKKHNS